jgi:hypothetical protein
MYNKKMPELYDLGFVKSHYKLHCFCCNSIINVGDEITQCAENYGMELRPRNFESVGFYTPYTGARWVHKCCQPEDYWTQYLANEHTKKLNNSNYDSDYNEYDYNEYDNYYNYETYQLYS